MRLVLIFFLCFVCLTLQVFSQPARLSAAQAGYLGGDTTCGIIWDEPILLSDTAYDAYSPKIALSGDDTVHVTWWCGKNRIPYAFSINGGLSWNLKDLIIDTVTYPYPFASNLIIAEDKNVYMFSANEPESPFGSPREIRMHKSTNSGISWSSPYIIGGDSSTGLYSANLYNDTLTIVYSPCISGYTKRPMMIFSTNAGETWAKRSDTLDGWTRTALTPGTLHLVRDVFVNGAQEKLYMRSFDLGNTWVDKETLSTVDGKWSYEHDIAACNSNNDSSQMMVAWRDGLACAGIVGCTIIERESRNNGTDWLTQEIMTEQPRGAWPSVALNEYKSSAVTWRDEIDNLGILNIYVRIRKHPDTLWCRPISISLINNYAIISDIALSSNAIHVVWEEKVGESFQIFYRRGAFLSTGVKDEKAILPKEFSLSQNYPNPFNPKTNIKYKVQSTEYVSIRVYDVFGREVATLLNETKQPGEYEVEWNADRFASGVYFVRMWAGKYFDTKKAVLMK